MNFEGEIGEIDLVERLVELGRERFTGAIRFENDGIIKIVYFKEGDVLSASTNDRTDAIDEILLRAGKVTREHVKQALAKRKESETLGDALLGLGFITRKELTWARRVQAIGILRSILGWTAGSFTIVADYLPKREEGTIFPLPQVLLELIVTDTDRARFEQAMASGSAVFDRTPAFADEFRRLGLNEDAEQIVAAIDGRSSAAEIVSRSGKDAFNVYKLLEALRLLGLIERRDKPEETLQVPLDEFAQYGAADAADAWPVENPDFSLDDDVAAAPAQTEPPTVEMPAWDAPALEPEPELDSTVAVPPPSAARSVWDEPDEDAFSSTEVIAPPPPPVIEPPPAPLAPEPQWGFDEAQIETARRAAVPLRSAGEAELPPRVIDDTPRPAKAGRGGLLVALLLIVLVAAGAYAGWRWWQGQNAAAEPTPVVTQRPARRPVIAPAPAPVTTATTATSSTTGTTATTASATAVAAPIAAATQTTTTTTSAPVRASVPAATPKASAPAPAAPPAIATNTAPLPKVTPRLERTKSGLPTITNTTDATPAAATPSSDALRTKYDGMARDFAARQGGNYTVQFELVCETASITRALHDGGADVWFVGTSYRGRPCYRVFWGRYGTSAEAAAASRQLPKSFGATPVVVKIPRG